MKKGYQTAFSWEKPPEHLGIGLKWKGKSGGTPSQKEENRKDTPTAERGRFKIEAYKMACKKRVTKAGKDRNRYRGNYNTIVRHRGQR